MKPEHPVGPTSLQQPHRSAQSVKKQTFPTSTRSPLCYLPWRPVPVARTGRWSNSFSWCHHGELTELGPVICHQPSWSLHEAVRLAHRTVPKAARTNTRGTCSAHPLTNDTSRFIFTATQWGTASGSQMRKLRLRGSKRRA